MCTLRALDKFAERWEKNRKKRNKNKTKQKERKREGGWGGGGGGEEDRMKNRKKGELGSSI